jgi:cation diffusion facilitator CzcD-associated flavoprotein CzcO
LTTLDYDFVTKYCIIGAGASGITAAKNLLALSIPCDIIEREDDVGGNWYFGKPNSSVYQSTHLISSKTMSAYTDYPMPDDYPDYLNHEQVLAYLRDYARHFNLYDHITFNTAVNEVSRDKEGYWLVTLDNGETRRYRGLIIANGHHWDAQIPQFDGNFSGQTLHSADYKTPDIFTDKRVLVIGSGNSGCDIAVDAVHRASKVFHSIRRSYHYIPKYIFGIPTDVFNEISVKMRTPLFLRRSISNLLVRLVLGKPQQYGLPKPDHKLLESHPTVNSQLLYHIGHGDIIHKPDIKKLDGDHVIFADDTREPIDIIVYATGFNITFPFIDSSELNAQDGKPHLFLHIFHPDHDNLFVAGLIQPDSGQFWLVDYQSQLIAHFIRAQDQKPAKAAEFRQIKAGPAPDIRGGRKLQTDRHYLEVDHFRYKTVLRRYIKSLR